MHFTPAHVIAIYLIQQGIATNPSTASSWPVFVGVLPDDVPSNVPNNALAAFDSTAVKDGRLMTGENIWHEGIEIMVRADQDQRNVGWKKAKDILALLELVQNTTVVVPTYEGISETSYKIANVTAATGAVALGQEEGPKRRELFSVNFLVTLKEI